MSWKISRRRLMGYAAATAAGIGGAHGPARAAGKPIRIGIVGPMKYVQGEHSWYGAEIAAEEINAGGGINVNGTKHPIELVRVDTNEILSTVDATSAVERAITISKVNFLVGGASSSAIMAMQEVAMDYKTIFLLGGSGSHPEITARVGRNYARYKYFFRPSPISATYIVDMVVESALELGRIIRRDLGIARPKVALLFEEAKWLDSQIPAYQKIFPEKGMDVVGLWRMSIKDLDVSAQLGAIRAAGAQILIPMTSGPVAIPVYRQIGELQIPVAVTGVNVEAEGAKFWEATGGSAAYLGVTLTSSSAPFSKRTVPFVEKFRKKHGVNPILTAAGSYNAILPLAEAIERAKTIEADAVVPELEKTDFDGTSGRLVFDKSHDVRYGSGYSGASAGQWLPPNGESVIWWATKRSDGSAVPGLVEYKLPPWMVNHWKKAG